MVVQANFTYSLLGKAFQKQTNRIGYHRKLRCVPPNFKTYLSKINKQ